MQPGPPPEYQQPGSPGQPAAGWPPPGHGGTQPTGAATTPPPGGVQRRTGRPGLVLLVALLVLLVARAGAGFARVFFGTWAAVVVATGLGAIVRAASADHRLLGGKSRFQYALFSDIGPSQYVFVAGLGLGLLVALA